MPVLKSRCANILLNFSTYFFHRGGDKDPCTILLWVGSDFVHPHISLCVFLRLYLFLWWLKQELWMKSEKNSKGPGSLSMVDIHHSG